MLMELAMQSDLFARAKPIQQGKLPSAQLAELLNGHIAWDKAAPAIRSWAAFAIHDAACQVLAITGQEKRRIALDKLPAHIRPMVEAEALRVWNWRRSNA